MKKIILLLSNLIVIFCATAQTPTFKWAKGVGGDKVDQAISTLTDASGNVYVTGTFIGKADFDPASPFKYLTSAGFEDEFILKLDAAGNYIWAKQLGGSETESVKTMSIDASGNIYTVGTFYGSMDCDPGAGTFYLTNKGYRDVFISKIDASGNFVWAKQFGGKYDEVVNSINIDAQGNIYTSGSFGDTVDFDPGTGIYKLGTSGDVDIFISKLDAAGNFVWAKKIGGKNNQYATTSTIDASGNIYTISGIDGTADFDPGTGTFDLTGNYDFFLSKLDASGNFVWAERLLRSGNNTINSITSDASGNILVMGTCYLTSDFDPGAGTLNLTAHGPGDGFITKLNASGNLIWAKNFGGASYTYASSISTDASGYIYATGAFEETVDFDPGTGITNLTAPGERQTYISKFDALGNFIWVRQLGGQNVTYIHLDAQKNIYTTGFYFGTEDFDPGTGVVNLKAAGSEGSDIFIHKMSQSTGAINSDIKINQVSIYPNPSNGILNIESQGLKDSELKIQILNSLGQIVLEEVEIHDSTFDIQHFSSGLYLVKVIIENQIVASQKIIKN